MNNTELIRQQLWCDVVRLNNELTFDAVVIEANKMVAEFDKRFQIDTEKLDSYIAEKEKRTELHRYYTGLRYKEGIKKVDLPTVYPIDKSLKEVFGENYYCDASRLSDVNNKVTIYAGLGVDGIEILAFLQE